MSFSEVTFVTHLRGDHPDRISNLQIVLDYYSALLPDSNYIMVEDDKVHNPMFDQVNYPPKRTQYLFVENDSWYHRTRAFNIGSIHAPLSTKAIVFMDTDCIISEKFMREGIDSILSNRADVVWPYNGTVIDTNEEVKQQFVESQLDYNFLFKMWRSHPITTVGSYNQHFGLRGSPTFHKSVGGVVMFDLQRFREVGGYNENFIAWGAEDNEIESRTKKLNLRHYRCEDPDAYLFHLYHSNAIRNNHPYYQSNFDEFHKVNNMSPKDLLSYINTWPWKQ